MTCIDCGKEITEPAKCGMNVCCGCCAVCYKQDDPCKDMTAAQYTETRHRAIIRDYTDGVEDSEMSKIYMIQKKTIYDILRQAGIYKLKKVGRKKKMA